MARSRPSFEVDVSSRRRGYQSDGVGFFAANRITNRYLANENSSVRYLRPTRTVFLSGNMRLQNKMTGQRQSWNEPYR